MRDGTQIGSLCTHEVAETGPRHAATVERDRACTELARDGSAGSFCERRRGQGKACRWEQEERGRAKESTVSLRRHRAEGQIGVRRAQLAREAPRRSAGATGRSSSEQRRAHAQLPSRLAALPGHAHRQSTPAQHTMRAHTLPLALALALVALSSPPTCTASPTTTLAVTASPSASPSWVRPRFAPPASYRMARVRRQDAAASGDTPAASDAGDSAGTEPGTGDAAATTTTPAAAETTTTTQAPAATTTTTQEPAETTTTAAPAPTTTTTEPQQATTAPTTTTQPPGASESLF